MAEIPLTKGYSAIVDEDDVALLSGWRWHAQARGGRVYARHNIEQRGKTIAIYMHRLLLMPPDGMDVDHIDGNGLNNRRSNLRVVTRAENTWNKNAVREAAPHWSPRKGKWRATIDFQRKKYEVGFYETREAALAARDFAAAVLRGGEPDPNFDPLTLPPTIRKLVLGRMFG